MAATGTSWPWVEMLQLVFGVVLMIGLVVYLRWRLQREFGGEQAEAGSEEVQEPEARGEGGGNSHEA